MRMWSDEKTQGFQRKILFVEIFDNVKRFGFLRPSSGRVS